MFAVSGPRGIAGGEPERILPDGSFELVFHRGAPFRSGGVAQPPAMLVGEVRRPLVIHATGLVDVLGVRFRIGGASAFFDFPMAELRDQILDLGCAASSDDLVSVLSVTRPRAAARLVNDAINEIERFHGNLSVRELVRRFGTTERTLERAFNDIVGLAPKQLCRVIRFQTSLKSDGLLAYYDQSHRIHEFRALAEVTPTEFWRERHAIHDAFVGNLQS